MSQSAKAILAVDDRPANLVALERILADVEAELVTVTSGEQALAETLRREFALAILDVQMPGMDGYELAELLRGDPATRHIPIIFLTARSGTESQIFKGYESGAVDYIVKPYHPSVLISKVNVFLEIRQQADEIRRQKEQLEAVNQELEAFAYSVSHDLRAPVRAIKGFGEALHEDNAGDLDDAGRSYLARVLSEAHRMERLIDDLLTLSRVTRQEMQREPVSLTRLARGIVDRLRAAAPSRTVDVDIAEGLDAEGDERLLGQALENLIGNAWKFTGREATPRIAVGAHRAPEGVVFFVRDNGAGFDPAYADKLFVPFQRLHRADEFPGTGVGLSTVRRVVRRHGGRIWCESREGEGATFFFTLGGSAPGEGTTS